MREIEKKKLSVGEIEFNFITIYCMLSFCDNLSFVKKYRIVSLFKIILYEKILFHAFFRYCGKKIPANWRRRVLAELKFNISSEEKL